MDRKEEIVSVARDLYETKGLSKTSVKDITSTMGVTRSLFYHYFPSKEEVTMAVLDDMVDEFVELLMNWNESRIPGDVCGGVKGCVKMFRMGLGNSDPLHKSLVMGENACLYLEFSSRVSETLTQYLMGTTVVDYKSLHNIKIEHLYEMFYMLIAGLIALGRRHPDVSDEVLGDLIIQALQLDVSKK